MNYIIDIMKKDHWKQVKEIYKQGMETGNATFEYIIPTWEKWDRGHLKIGRLVAKNGDKILGWIALSPVSEREVFKGVAEVSIYIHNDYKGKGIGSSLMKALINETEKNNIWTIEAKIFPENKGSLKLHKKHGFKIVGVREKIGKMNSGQWRDIVLLERRSNK